MLIQPITSEKISIIKDLAYQIWPTAYSEILSQEQIDYMLDLFYNEEALLQQLNNGQQFIIIKDDTKFLGFAAFEYNCNHSGKTKLHKLYVLPETQGKGIGKLLIDYIEVKTKEIGNSSLYLNVNKYNSAQSFYSKLGFQIIAEEIIDIGNDFVMDDFIMEKKLC